MKFVHFLQWQCRELGFESSNKSRDDQANYYEGNNGMIWLGSMSCNGTKLALEQCSRSALETNTQNSDEKCNSSQINSETQKFFCNFDFQLSSEEHESINSKISATATTRIVLSSHNDTSTIIIINNNTTVVKNGPSISHSIITAIASSIGAASMAFMAFCIYKKGVRKGEILIQISLKRVVQMVLLQKVPVILVTRNGAQYVRC